MMTNLISSDKKTLVVGIGLSGQSVCRYLKSRDRQFSVWDTRSEPPNLDQFTSRFPSVELLLGQVEPGLLEQFDEIVVSPGLDLRCDPFVSASRAGAKFISDVELFVREVSKPIVAITGSNGKSSVTTLVGQMLGFAGEKVQVGGNIGIPVLDLLDSSSSNFVDVDVYVLELSSFQLDITESLRPVVSTVLNISEDHMDRYDSFQDYVQSKLSIYKHASVSIINKDDVLSQPLIGVNKARKFFSSVTPDLNEFGLINDHGEWSIVRNDAGILTKLVMSDDLKVKGKHNLMNAAAALALCEGYYQALNRVVPQGKLIESLKQFSGLSHRCEWVGKFNDVDFINDSKGTNVGATVSAVNGLGEVISGKIFLILGGEAKGASFHDLAAPILKYAKSVFVYGKDSKAIASELSSTQKLVTVENLNEAFEKAVIESKAGDLVLLSPACASWDMYKSFEKRGDHFKALFNNLVDEGSVKYVDVVEYQ